MIDEVITEGPSVADAVDAALEELGVQQDAVEYEVLSESGSGAARVCVRLRPGVVATPDATEDEDEDSAQGDAAATADGDVELTDEQLEMRFTIFSPAFWL
jgi:predicted RNA-binding protein Jag